MFRRSLRVFTLWILAATLLAACGVAASPTALPTGEVSPTEPSPRSALNPPIPTSSCPSSGEITVSLAMPQPTDVLLELAWEGGFTRPELAFAFGRVPEFSLLPDGSAYYIDPPEWDRAQMMVAYLSPAETKDLVQRVLDLGFERLESHTDSCRPLPDGSCECVADAGESVLRVRLPSGELREIRNYDGFANDPDALMAIRTLLQDYRHPQAEACKPDKAALFILPVSPSPDLPVQDWPLHPAWLTGSTPDYPCARALSGSDLQALLAVTGRNMGDFYFRQADQVYGVYLVPWLPGVDYTDLIASSGQACPPAEALTSAPLLALKDTDWVLVSLNGNNPVEGSPVTLAFHPGSYMDGAAGCNSYGVDYIADGNRFQVPEIHRTRDACEAPDIMQQEAAFFEALANVAVYRATEERLEFSDAAGETTLAFARVLPPTMGGVLPGTKWVLTSLRGQPLVPGTHIDLEFGQAWYSGFLGCNYYGGGPDSGKYAATDDGTLTILGCAVTAIGCPPAIAAQEQAYIEAFTSAASYRLVDDRLEIQDATGETILVYARQPEYTMEPTDQEPSNLRDTTSTTSTLGVLIIGAYIDGRSQLVVQGNAVHWHHLEFAAPGRHLGANQPTYLNGVAWYPTWPDNPDAENRDCGCNSSTYVGIPPLATRDQTVSLEIVRAREKVTIIQQPEEDNDYTLIVQFDDNVSLGLDWYEVDISYITGDQPVGVPGAHDQPITPTAVASPAPASAVVESDLLDGWYQYTNLEYGFSFHFPPDWTLEESPHSVILRHKLVDTLEFSIRYRRATEDVEIWRTGMPAGDFVTRGSVPCLGREISRDVLVYEGKDKLVLYNYASAIPWGDLVFDLVLEDMRSDYETVELPEDVQRQIDQVVTSFELEN